MNEQKVLAAIADVLPAVRDSAARVDRSARIEPRLIGRLAEAGLFRLLQPRAFGGLAADPADHLEAVHRIAGECGSTGWLASVLGVHSWHLGLFPEKAQREVWGPDPSALISSSYAPSGRATPVGGGYRLTGHWSFSSGCEHARWCLTGALATDPTGGPPRMMACLLPRADYRIVPNWDTVGLRGTGSHDIVVEDVFVPEHRTLGTGPSTPEVPPGLAVNREPVYRMPFPSMLTTAVAAPVVGIAAGVYAEHLAGLRERLADGSARAADREPERHLRLARAIGEVDAARTSLTGNIAELYGYASRALPPPMALRARTRRDQVLAVERAVGAVDDLLAGAGGSALRTSSANPQRAWRDVHTGAGHAANEVRRGLLPSVQESLGLPVSEAMV